MEIIGTDVLSGVGPAGQTLLVVFRGQGGDRVTVETVKASNDVRDDESAILRAKAILTQIVAFPQRRKRRPCSLKWSRSVSQWKLRVANLTLL